jgi:hypothetical protein
MPPYKNRPPLSNDNPERTAHAARTGPPHNVATAALLGLRPDLFARAPHALTGTRKQQRDPRLTPRSGLLFTFREQHQQPAVGQSGSRHLAGYGDRGMR